jgi:TRAP-type mannitol/chloroaromatic compound transport system substrate-binding protein
MRTKEKQDKTATRKESRRSFLKTAAVATGAAAGVMGFPGVMRLSAAAPIKWKMQTCWDAGTVGYTLFQSFGKKVSEMTENQLQIECLPAGAIVGTFEMFDAVKAGVFEAYHSFDVYWPGKVPACTFLSSYPFAMDRPDQWDTWYGVLGGKEIAREAYGKHNMMYLGPIQHDDNLIHSKVPIRSFEDFKGKKIRYPGGIIADIYRAAGVSTVLLPGGEVYPALEKGVIDASDFVGWAVNYNLGFAEIAKYIIIGGGGPPPPPPPPPPEAGRRGENKWKALPKHLQSLLEAAVTWHSYDHYVGIQKADLEAIPKYLAKGVEVIRLKDSDIEKFKKFAPELWVAWAKKDPLAMKAFKSQWEYLKSLKIGYYKDSDMVDSKGKKIVF